MEINQIHNEDCMIFMNKTDLKVDTVLTSPPYNTSRTDKYTMSKDKYNSRYEGFEDNKTDNEYIDWTVDLFNGFDKILKPNGNVLYNMSYSSENTTLMFLTVAEIIKQTNFTLADSIVWKKRSAIPNNRSSNKLTRICEYVFVFCRKNEFKTFDSNKKVVSVIERTGQKNFENVYNYIEAKNNDGSTKLNKATFSTELCEKLLVMYTKEGSLVYDPFMGTGTTANACKNLGLNYIGTEISNEQCLYAENRLMNT
ncbi:site-specific DNA-methyltransferase [Lysinibacillus sp. M3]|uniref:Methyltransferase n=1 Tax=Lysinibacillus zambalensis TaxID=3160866 RepID=A0ABV1MRH7_9BACI